MLYEKEKTIQLLKKKLKILATQLIQAIELTELEKEKETLNDELNDCKEKILKFVGEKKQWERDMSLLVENEKYLKKKQVELEKELNEKGKDPELQIISPPAQVNIDFVLE